MERLKFANSFEINRKSNRMLLDSTVGITYDFTISNGNRDFHWNFAYVHDKTPGKYNVSGCHLTLDKSSNDHLSMKTWQSSKCKFILESRGLPDEEFTSEGENQGPYNISKFNVPKDHAIYQFLFNFVKNPNEMTAILKIELELPKKFFADKKEKPYKILTVKDKHDFHIICKDGVFYTRKQDLMRLHNFSSNSDYFSNKFQNEWKDKYEVKMDISLETMKLFVTYQITETYVAPKKMDLSLLKEIMKMAAEIGFENNDDFIRLLIINANRELEDSSPSLYDLVSCIKLAHSHGYSRIQELIEPILDKKYYTEINNQYKPKAKFVDEEKKNIHKMLHEEDPKAVFDWEKSMFHRIMWFRSKHQQG